MPQHVGQVQVHEADSVILREHVRLPVHVTNWVLPRSGDVLVSTPLLSIVEWLLGLVHKLGEITVSLSCKSSKDC